jgi:hypothetical protein
VTDSSQCAEESYVFALSEPLKKTSLRWDIHRRYLAHLEGGWEKEEQRCSVLVLLESLVLEDILVLQGFLRRVEESKELKVFMSVCHLF